MQAKNFIGKRLATRALILTFALAFLGARPAVAFVDACNGNFPGDAGNTKASALELTSTVSPHNASACTADAPFGDIDYFSFTFSTPAALRIQFSAGGTVAKLTNPAGTLVPPTAAGDQSGWTIRATAGKWYLQMTQPPTPNGIYQFSYAYTQHTECDQNQANPSVGVDAGNTQATASLLATPPTPSACVGRVWGSTGSRLPTTDPHDWYKIPLTQGATLRVGVFAVTDSTDGCTSCQGTGGYTVEVRTPAGALGTSQAGVAGGPPVNIEYAVPANGTYFIHITSPNDVLYNMDAGTTALGSVPPALGTISGDCSLPAAFDAGNTSATATDISPETACHGSLGVAPVTDNDDWFKFDSVTFGTQGVRIVVTGDGTLDPSVSIFPPGSATPRQVSNKASPQPDVINVRTSDKPGVWKFQIHRVAGRGSYLLVIDQAAGDTSNTQIPPSGVPSVGTATADCSLSTTPSDAPNTGTSPQLVSNDNACIGSLGITNPADTDDWYKFDNSFGQLTGVRIVVSGDGRLDPEVSLWDPAGVRRGLAATAGLQPELISSPIDKVGFWKIQIHRTSGNGNYVFMINTTGGNLATPSGVPTVSTATGDCSLSTTPSDAPNTGTSPQQVSNDNACIGSLGLTNPADADDWYKFDNSFGQLTGVRIVVSGDARLDPEVSLWDPAGVRRGYAKTGSPQPELISVPINKAGSWKIQIHRTSGAGNYVFMINTTGGNLATPSGIPTIGPIPTVSVPPVLGSDDQCKGQGDASNVSTSPTKIPTSNACYGNLGTPSSDTADWYSFDGVYGRDIRLVVSAEPQVNVDVILWSATGFAFVSANPAPQPEVLQVRSGSTGLWKIQVIRKNAAAGHYLLALDMRPRVLPPLPAPTVPTLSGDCQQPGDASNDYTTARRIKSYDACHGASGVVGDVDDYYKFYGQAGLRLVVEYQGNFTIDNDLYIYEPEFSVKRVWDSESAGASPESVHMFLAVTGDYRLRTVARSGNGDYGFTIYVGF